MASMLTSSYTMPAKYAPLGESVVAVNVDVSHRFINSEIHAESLRSVGSCSRKNAVRSGLSSELSRSRRLCDRPTGNRLPRGMAATWLFVAKLKNMQLIEREWEGRMRNRGLETAVPATFSTREGNSRGDTCHTVRDTGSERAVSDTAYDSVSASSGASNPSHSDPLIHNLPALRGVKSSDAKMSRRGRSADRSEWMPRVHSRPPDFGSYEQATPDGRILGREDIGRQNGPGDSGWTETGKNKYGKSREMPARPRSEVLSHKDIRTGGDKAIDVETRPVPAWQGGELTAGRWRTGGGRKASEDGSKVKQRIHLRENPGEVKPRFVLKSSTVQVGVQAGVSPSSWDRNGGQGVGKEMRQVGVDEWGIGEEDLSPHVREPSDSQRQEKVEGSFTRHSTVRSQQIIEAAEDWDLGSDDWEGATSAEDADLAKDSQSPVSASSARSAARVSQSAESAKGTAPFQWGSATSAVTRERTAESAEEELRSHRQVAKQAFVAALKARQINGYHASDLADQTPLLIDHIIVQAVLLKGEEGYEGMSFNRRCLLAIERNGCVDAIKWLKHVKTSLPKVAELLTLACADVALGHAEMARLQEPLQWLLRLGWSGKELGLRVSQQPGLAKMSTEMLETRAQFLEGLGIERCQLAHVSGKAGGILTVSEAEISKKAEFLRRIAGRGGGGEGGEEGGAEGGAEMMAERSFVALIAKAPSLLGVQVPLAEMEAKVAFVERLGIQKSTLARVVNTCPKLFSASLEGQWEPTLKYMELLGIRREEWGVMIAQHPTILTLNFATDILPKMQFLDTVGIRHEARAHVLVRFPAFLTYDLDKRIRPNVRFLMESVGVSVGGLGKLVAQEPELMGVNIGKLTRTVRFLEDVGFRQKQIGNMLVAFPKLIQYRSEVLRPKWRFLRKQMGLSLEALLTFPRYFSYDLVKRIAPRFLKLKHRGLTFTLRHMLACTDDQFAQRMLDAQARGIVGAELRKHEYENIRVEGVHIGMQQDCDENLSGEEGEEVKRNRTSFVQGDIDDYDNVEDHIDDYEGDVEDNHHDNSNNLCGGHQN